MPKYEVIVSKTSTFILLTEQEDEEATREYAYDTIKSGNADPYFEDWHFDMSEK